MAASIVEREAAARAPAGMSSDCRSTCSHCRRRRRRPMDRARAPGSSTRCGEPMGGGVMAGAGSHRGLAATMPSDVQPVPHGPARPCRALLPRHRAGTRRRAGRTLRHGPHPAADRRPTAGVKARSARTPVGTPARRTLALAVVEGAQNSYARFAGCSDGQDVRIQPPFGHVLIDEILANQGLTRV